jgi:DNA repair exonuclease SbcCD ATPase subunit
MDDQDRRLEILKAEEAVRQLAEELARAGDSRLAAEEVAGQFEAARATLEETRQVLEAAVRALRQTSEDAQSALAEARTRLGSAEGQVARAAGELRGAAQQLDGIMPAVGKMVGQAEESLANRLRDLGRWVRASLVLSALAFGSAVVCLILVLLRKG